jgi:uncharacterized protein with von Willebrand factor type A (vWA) domain
MAEHDTNNLNALLTERPIDAEASDSGILQTQQKPESPTVLSLDRWNLRRGNEVAKEWAEFGAGEIDPLVVADAHASVFEPAPQLAERSADKNRAAWWRQLMETPEYQSLRGSTCLDDDMASIAAKSICDQWMQYAAENPEPGDGEPEPGSDGEDIGKTLARIRSTQNALGGAKESVEAAQDLSAGLGMGGGGGSLDRAALAKYFKQVQNSNMLRSILAMAGRMRRLCQSLQRQKTSATRGEVTGIELCGDIGRLVPMELAKVAGAIPELELLSLLHLAQRRSLGYKHKKNEPKRSGPIVVCVDESGSMNGDKIIAAKGLAMALAWLASHQNRWIALVGFAGGTEGTRLALPPRHNQQEQLIEWLLHFYGGGTTLDVPLDELPKNYWPEFVAAGLPTGKTDVILITDAIVNCDDEMRDAYLKWANAEQVKTYGIVIGGDEPGDLEKICTRHWSLPELSMDTDAVQNVLSI